MISFFVIKSRRSNEYKRKVLAVPVFTFTVNDRNVGERLEAQSCLVELSDWRKCGCSHLYPRQSPRSNLKVRLAHRSALTNYRSTFPGTYKESGIKSADRQALNSPDRSYSCNSGPVNLGDIGGGYELIGIRHYWKHIQTKLLDVDVGTTWVLGSVGLIACQRSIHVLFVACSLGRKGKTTRVHGQRDKLRSEGTSLGMTRQEGRHIKDRSD